MQKGLKSQQEMKHEPKKKTISLDVFYVSLLSRFFYVYHSNTVYRHYVTDHSSHQ